MREAIVPQGLAAAAAASGFSPAIRSGGFLFLTGATGALVEFRVIARDGAQVTA
jgi:hypothetical protein